MVAQGVESPHTIRLQYGETLAVLYVASDCEAMRQSHEMEIVYTLEDLACAPFNFLIFNF